MYLLEIILRDIKHTNIGSITSKYLCAGRDNENAPITKSSAIVKDLLISEKRCFFESKKNGRKISNDNTENKPANIFLLISRSKGPKFNSPPS